MGTGSPCSISLSSPYLIFLMHPVYLYFSSQKTRTKYNKTCPHIKTRQDKPTGRKESQQTKESDTPASTVTSHAK